MGATLALPEPGLTVHGFPGDCAGFQTFANEGILQKVGRCNGEHPTCELSPSTCNTRLWETAPDVWDLVEEIQESRQLLPCGHAPFRNPRGVDGYTCTSDECDRVFSRATVEGVLD